MLAKDIEDNMAIGSHGAKAIIANAGETKNVRILTHCNTGSLATAGYGTALGVIRSLHSEKRLGIIAYYTFPLVFKKTKYAHNDLITGIHVIYQLDLMC